MCLMMTDHEPTSTRLINIPVKLGGFKNILKSHKLLIYTNDLDLNRSSQFSDIGTGAGYLRLGKIGFGNENQINNQINNFDQGNQNSNQNFNPYLNSQKGALMIVPIPNHYHQTMFGLLDVNTEQMKMFRKKLFNECEYLKPMSKGIFTNYSLSADDKPKLLVHDVGNYKITVAPNYDDLMKRVDWNSFVLPPDFETRKKTLSSVLYSGNWAYVIAQAQISVANDGFGVCYLDPGYDYFPTAHEFTEKNNLNSNLKNYSNNGSEKSNVSKQNYKVKYDVKCYNCFTNKNELTRFVGNSFKTYTLSDRKVINEIFKFLPNKLVNTENGNEVKYSVLNPHKPINFWEIEGLYLNGNVIVE